MFLLSLFLRKKKLPDSFSLHGSVMRHSLLKGISAQIVSAAVSVCSLPSLTCSAMMSWGEHRPGTALPLPQSLGKMQRLAYMVFLITFGLWDMAIHLSRGISVAMRIKVCEHFGVPEWSIVASSTTKGECCLPSPQAPSQVCCLPLSLAEVKRLFFSLSMDRLYVDLDLL